MPLSRRSMPWPRRSMRFAASWRRAIAPMRRKRFPVLARRLPVVRAAFANIGALGDRREIAGIDAEIGEGAVVELVQLGEDGAARQPAPSGGKQTAERTALGRGKGGAALGGGG